MTVDYSQVLTKLKKAQQKPITLPPELKEEQASSKKEAQEKQEEVKTEER